MPMLKRDQPKEPVIEEVLPWKIAVGDCRELCSTLPAQSVDAIITDPPYELGFMGKEWDKRGVAFEKLTWNAMFRVLKPGGYMLVFGGTRTFHRIACAIEDAGFELRDTLCWMYGSGFPKSHDPAKALDKRYGMHRGKSNGVSSANGSMSGANYVRTNKGKAIHEDAQALEGQGTALKPAYEPITLAQRPFKGNVADCMRTHGTGGLNIDECRIGNNAGWSYPNGRGGEGCFGRESLGTNLDEPMAATKGRWPANLIHDGSDEVVSCFPSTGPSKSSMRGVGLTGDANKVYGKGDPEFDTLRGHSDNGGSAARFFYAAKASKKDRDDGLHEFDCIPPAGMQGRNDGTMGSVTMSRNHHPTVKPISLMRYLCRLVTPKSGLILDPFMGSGSTGKAAMYEGFRFIGMEMSDDYAKIAEARIRHAWETKKAHPEG